MLSSVDMGDGFEEKGQHHILTGVGLTKILKRDMIKDYETLWISSIK